MLKPINEGDAVKRYDLDFGKVSFFKNYLIIEVAEGISFNHEKAIALSKLTNYHFGNREFGYISNRVNSYSLQPTDYLKIKQALPNIKVFAIVTYNDFQKASVKIESMFYHDHMFAFDCVKEAVDWVKNQLK